MSRTLPITMTAILAAALGGCGKQASETQKSDAYPIANMAMSNEHKTGKATGTVTAIDTATGKITLDHSPVPELQWPAMTMGFGAKPEQLKGVAVGDKVSFQFTMTGSKAEIISIERN